MMNRKNFKMTPLWLSAFGLLGLSSVAMLGGPSAYADAVQMTSVNGDYDPNHLNAISVQPGDMITLSADLINEQNGGTADGVDVEDFVWQADDSSTDVCDASSTEDCLDTSNFEVNDYGVSFYVPATMGAQITIAVTSSDPNADANSYDTIVLTNANYAAGVTAPPVVVVTDPSDYNQSSFDPDYAVAGQGNWVYINGDRYWVPNTYMLQAGAEWTPYQNGYWTLSDGFGWTWVSYDPWGWATDHYGIWRFHETYGWAWRPFEDRHYEPNCVTFFNDSEHTGWYPYHAGYDAGYRDGYNQGFRDGFGPGENPRDGFGDANYRYHPGFSVVGNRDFNRANIHDGLINEGFFENGKETFRNHAETAQIVQGCERNNAFTPFPGGRDLDSSRDYMRSHAGNPTETQTQTIRSRGGASIIRPLPVHQVPVGYENIGKAWQGNRPRPVGTVINGSSGRPVAIPPSTNGRGFVPPPVAKGANGNPIVLPPRTNRPAAPHSGNPIVGGQPHPVKPTAPISGLPGLNGNHPRPSGPAPIVPRPTEPTQGPGHGPGHGEPNQPGGPGHGNKPTPPVAPKPAPMPIVPAPRPQPVAPAPRPVAPAPRPRPVAPTPRPVAPAPRPQPPGSWNPAPRPQPVAPAPRPQPPVYNPPAPRPEPVAPRPQPPVYNPPAPRPEPAPPVFNNPQPRPEPRPEPAPPSFGGGGEHGGEPGHNGHK